MQFASTLQRHGRGGLREISAWIEAWTEGKQGHQEMKARNAALIVPLGRDGTRVRPIARAEGLVKLAQGTLIEIIHRERRKNAEASKTKSEWKAQHIGQFLVRTPMGSIGFSKNHEEMAERQTHRDTGPARPLERVRECPQRLRPVGGQHTATRNELHARSSVGKRKDKCLGSERTKAGNNSLSTEVHGKEHHTPMWLQRTDNSKLQQQTGLGTRNDRRTTRRRLFQPRARYHFC